MRIKRECGLACLPFKLRADLASSCLQVADRKRPPPAREPSPERSGPHLSPPPRKRNRMESASLSPVPIGNTRSGTALKESKMRPDEAERYERAESNIGRDISDRRRADERRSGRDYDRRERDKYARVRDKDRRADIRESDRPSGRDRLRNDRRDSGDRRDYDRDRREYNRDFDGDRRDGRGREAPAKRNEERDRRRDSPSRKLPDPGPIQRYGVTTLGKDYQRYANDFKLRL